MLELSSPRSMNKKEPKLYFMERVGTCSGTCVQEGILLVQLEFEGSLALVLCKGRKISRPGRKMFPFSARDVNKTGAGNVQTLLK